MKTTDRKILIALDCFYYWFKHPDLLIPLERLLSDLIDNEGLSGVELFLPHDHVESWIGALEKGGPCLPHRYGCLTPALQRKILRLPCNSVHLDDLKNLSDYSYEWLVAAIKLISNEIHCIEFTTHPDELSLAELGIVNELFQFDCTLSIENMDCRKSNCRELTEIANILEHCPNLSCTFDLCHWLENGRDVAEPELFDFMTKYRERISKIHFSVPASIAPDYLARPEIETFHFLGQESGNLNASKFLSDFEHFEKWVIEGIVPPGSEQLLNQEISRLSHLAAEVL